MVVELASAIANVIRIYSARTCDNAAFLELAVFLSKQSTSEWLPREQGQKIWQSQHLIPHPAISSNCRKKENNCGNTMKRKRKKAHLQYNMQEQHKAGDYKEQYNAKRRANT